MATYGTYNTDITKIKNTAMASWSGFIYQGLCALHHSLSLLLSDWNNTQSKYLSLEAYEDFVILDSAQNIESMHQCKCIKKSTDYDDECKKMFDKYDYWVSQNQISHNNNKSQALWFHSNQNNALTCGVQAYTNNPQSPLQLYDDIKKVVENIMSNNRFPGSSANKSDKLIVSISKKVSDIHQQSMQNSGKGFDIAVANPIPFTEFVDILKSNNNDYSSIELVETCRFYLILTLRDRLITKRDPNTQKIEDFITRIGELNQQELTALVCRLFPDKDIFSDSIRIHDMFSSSRGNYLFNVINDSLENIDMNGINWRNTQNDLLTPSTLGSDKDADEYCPDIVNNPKTNDLRRDYRWIVGDVKNKVDDIDKAANQISQINAKDYSDISQHRKVGILDIKSKNNGNY